MKCKITTNKGEVFFRKIQNSTELNTYFTGMLDALKKDLEGYTFEFVEGDCFDVPNYMIKGCKMIYFPKEDDNQFSIKSQLI